MKVSEVEDRFFTEQTNGLWWSMFRGMHMYFDSGVHEYLQTIVTFFSGDIDPVLSATTTHIVIDERDISRVTLYQLQAIRFVSFVIFPFLVASC